MPETLNLNIGNANPYLQNNSVEQNIALINQQVAQLNNLKNKLISNSSPVKGNEDLWDSIDKEVNSLTDDQKEILLKDEDYIKTNNSLQTLIQEFLIDSVKDKIANSEEGRKLLEKHLLNIKDKKKDIIKQSKNEMELFKKFQIAVQANPNLTYNEFINNIK